MPNPVLLAVHDRPNVAVRPQVVTATTEVFEIEVTRPAGSGPPCGSSTANIGAGLARSARKSNAVPFVLLYSDVQADFSAADFARLFAEVTTEASPLDDLHIEIGFSSAFDLGPYEAAQQEQQRCGSRCERSHCCASPRAFENGAIPNPFFNRIQFNRRRPRAGTAPDSRTTLAT